MTELIVETEGPVGRIRLNRPRAIHALTVAMCEGVLAALEDWRGDDGVRAIILDHAPAPDGDPKLSRGFCAGGDIRLLADSGAGDGSAARHFFATEYRMNHRLFTYAKPIVAFMDGITMGGGVGISQPARFRVATENTRLAMPETGIGLFPDVGGGWYLSRLPGRIGQYLALTGHRLDGAESHALGLATLRTKSPQTMKVSLRLLKEGAGMASFADEMRQEYAVASRVVQRHDFLEGVRAVIVDKDNVPRWDPATPGNVSDHVIDQIFAPLPDAEAWAPD